MHLRGNIKNIMSQDEDHYQNKGYYKITENQFSISYLYRDRGPC